MVTHDNKNIDHHCSSIILKFYMIVCIYLYVYIIFTKVQAVS